MVVAFWNNCSELIFSLPVRILLVIIRSRLSLLRCNEYWVESQGFQSLFIWHFVDRSAVVVLPMPEYYVCDIQENAFNPQRTTEAHNWRDGQYTAGLIEKAEIPNGSNIHDDHLCPNTVRSPCTLRQWYRIYSEFQIQLMRFCQCYFGDFLVVGLMVIKLLCEL